VSGTVPSAGYEIRVEGVLDQRWTAWFEGLEITSDYWGSTTTRSTAACSASATARWRN